MDPELVAWMHSAEVQAVVAKYSAAGETRSESAPEPEKDSAQGKLPGFEPGDSEGIIAR